MASIVILPKQGLQMTAGIITSWLVKEGGEVKKGEPLFEMETDKLTIAIEAEESGTLLKTFHEEGEEVPITTPIAVIGEPGEDYSGLLQAAAPQAARAQAEEAAAVPGQPALKEEAQPDGGKIFSSPRARMRAKEKGIDIAAVSPSGPSGLVIERDVLAFESAKASPLARKVAAQAGVALTGVQGSGAHGKVMAGDVRAAMGAQAPAPAQTTRIPLTGMRRIIAQRMKESLALQAQANHRIKVDMGACIALRKAYKEAGQGLSFNDIMIRVVARALLDEPYMNARMEEDCILFNNSVNIGLAVATEAGLLVPVVKNAQGMDLKTIAQATADLVEKTLQNRLSPDELQGGTFTISNLGMYGLSSFTAIVNAPESGILALGGIEETPVARAGEVVVRPMMEISLTYDHRIIDGAPAARFLKRVKQLLEAPMLLL